MAVDKGCPPDAQALSPPASVHTIDNLLNDWAAGADSFLLGHRYGIGDVYVRVIVRVARMFGDPRAAYRHPGKSKRTKRQPAMQVPAVEGAGQ